MACSPAPARPVTGVVRWLRCARRDVLVTFSNHHIADAGRRVDVLEAALESIRCAMYSSDVELHYQAVHGLWELACTSANHWHVTYSIFEAAAVAVRSPELRVQSIAAAAVWRFALHPPTLARMPVEELVPALLHALLRDHGQLASAAEPPSAQVAAAAEMAAQQAATPSARSRRMRGGEPSASGGGSFVAPRLSGLLPPVLVSDDDAAHDLQRARAVACTGYTLVEQRIWQAGALLALLSTAEGRRAFHRNRLTLRLLPVLEAPDARSPLPLKAACAALLARAAEVAPPVCRNLLEPGCLAQLVKLLCAQGAHIHWRTQLQVADLLRFAFARVRCHPSRAADALVLQYLPRVVGTVRAATLPLLGRLRAYIAAAKPHHEHEEVRRRRARARGGGGGGGGTPSLASAVCACAPDALRAHTCVYGRRPTALTWTWATSSAPAARLARWRRCPPIAPDAPPLSHLRRRIAPPSCCGASWARCGAWSAACAPPRRSR